MNSGMLRPSGGGGEIIQVERLEVKDAQMNKTKMSVDTFAGVV